MKKKMVYLAIAAAVVAASSAYTINTYANSGQHAFEEESNPSDGTISLTDIQNKMLNSIDYFSTAQGAYRITEKFIGADNTIEFEIQQGGQPASIVKITNNANGVASEQWFSDGELTKVSHKNKSFQKFKVEKPLIFDPAKPRFFKDASNVWTYVYRQDPAVADAASDVMFPQVYAFWLNDSSARIVGQEQYLDRQATIIEGNLEPVLAEKHKADHFKMWVDAETGVLLKLEELDKNSQIVNTITVDSIRINEVVGVKKPSSPADYKEVKRDRSADKQSSVK